MRSPDTFWTRDILPYETELRAFLKSRFSCLHDTDDIIQESYLRLVRACERQEIGSARGFLFITARNIALSLVRRSKCAPFVEMPDASEEWIPQEGASIPDLVNRGDVQSLIVDAIEALPPRCRTIFKLRHLEELPHREVAQRLGISPNTVQNHVMRGTRQCAVFLRTRGVRGSGGGVHAGRRIGGGPGELRHASSTSVE